jgi:hypothetical protein
MKYGVGVCAVGALVILGLEYLLHVRENAMGDKALFALILAAGAGFFWFRSARQK